MEEPRPRITQWTVAALAGVSQTTVSLVVNGKTGPGHRIPEETRARVLAAIRATAYTGGARAGGAPSTVDRLIGVFTYEQAFPIPETDVFMEWMTGIETATREARADLLVFTRSAATEGRRRLLHESNRLRLVDGCLLLGRAMDALELERLVDSGYPFVALGRRDAAGGRVPYVGADYRSAAAALAEEAVALGHRRIGVLHRRLDAEASLDKHAGVADGVGADAETVEVEVARGDVRSAWHRLRGALPTVVLVEHPLDALELCEVLRLEGLSVPGDLSMIALGDHRRLRALAPGLTRLAAPRTTLGERAVELLLDRLRTPVPGAPAQELIACTVERGATLAAPAARSAAD